MHDSGRTRPLLVHQIGERDAAQIIVHAAIEIGPQVVRHADMLFMTVGLAATLRRIEYLINGTNDVGDGDCADIPTEVIAATGAAHAGDEIAFSEFAEQLLKVRKRDALPLADACERDRTMLMVHGDVEHRGDGKTAFGGQSHGKPRINVYSNS